MEKTTRPFKYDLNQIPYDYTVEVKNRFKGLDLIDECLMNYGWKFVTLYRRQGSRSSPRKRKAKWMSEEALQIAVKRREVKSKGEKERYTHLTEKAMAPHSSTLAWKIPWAEEPGRLWSKGLRRVRHD